MSEPNADMRKAWDGLDGYIWAASADQYETRGAGHRRLLLQAAAIAPGERVLDVGGGNGASTREAARMAAPGEAVGMPGPFGLADRDQVSTLLSATGFADVGFADVREPSVFGATAAEAYALM